MTWYCSYAVSSTICTNLCTNMPWSICNRYVQKKEQKRVLPTETPDHYYIEPFEGLWSVATRFRHCSSASPKGPEQKKVAMSPSSTLFMTVSMMLNTSTWHSSSYSMRHLWRTQFGMTQAWTSSYGSYAAACIYCRICCNMKGTYLVPEASNRALIISCLLYTSPSPRD